MKFSEFLEKTFPIGNPYNRKQYGIIHNTIKWIALRFSYFFYLIGISANILDLISVIILFPTFLTLYFSIINQNLLLFFISFLFLGGILFIDFIDGPLSKIRSNYSVIGNEIDNLCPEICRISALIIIGFVSKNVPTLIIAAIISIIINTYVFDTRDSVSKYSGLLNELFANGKLSLNSIRLLVCLIMPTYVFFYILDFNFISYLATATIIIYLFLCIVWIIISTKDRKLNKL